MSWPSLQLSNTVALLNVRSILLASTCLFSYSLRLEPQLIHVAEVIFRTVPQRRDAVLCYVTSAAPFAPTIRAWQLDISQWLDGWRAQFLLFCLTPLHEPKWAYEIRLTISKDPDWSLNSVFSSSNVLYFLLGVFTDHKEWCSISCSKETLVNSFPLFLIPSPQHDRDLLLFYRCILVAA